MTTREQYKIGILIVGMLIIAGALSYLRPDRPSAQSQASPAYRPPTAPVAAASVEPQYPIHKTIAINQNGWSDEIGFNGDDRIEWNLLEDDVWLDNKVNRTEEFRDFPRNDTRSKLRLLHEAIRTLQFRVTPGTPVQTGTVEITIRKNVASDFNTRENLLSAASPGLTASGTKAGPLWPSELTPTRVGIIPPDDFVSGGIITDTIYPIEDVLYETKQGWRVAPFAVNDQFEAAHDPRGFRIRLSSPDNPIVVRFKVVSIQTNNTPTTGQQTLATQGVPNRNSTQPTQPAARPAVRPYVAPRQPSNYRTSPGGPS